MHVRNWDLLKTVFAVAKTGSYRKAAHDLGKSATTVARHVEQIEEELRAPVFVLRDSIWVPTDLGEQLQQVAREMLSSLSQVENQGTSQAGCIGSIRLSTVSYIAKNFLADQTGKWWSANPLSELTIDANDETIAIELGEADAGLRLARPNQVGITRFKVAICPIGLFFPSKKPSDQWIGLPEPLDSLPEMQMAKSYFGHGPSMRLDSFEAIEKASRSTGLSCVLPTCIVQEDKGLRRITDSKRESLCLREVWFLFHEKRKNDPAIQALSGWIKDTFKSPAHCLCGNCLNNAGFTLE